MMAFSVDTDHPIAKTSMDYLYPAGAIVDNTVNPKFNAKLIDLFDNRRISIMDIGCAGGGMVKSFIDTGHVAVGIEGTDHNKNKRAMEWGKIPGNLFCADATQPFTVHLGDHEPYKFDVITAWEFFEHIPGKGLPGVMDNINRHLKPEGLVIVTINLLPSGRHVTIKYPEEWNSYFEEYGLISNGDLISFLDPDWLRVCKGSFGVVMNRKSKHE